MKYSEVIAVYYVYTSCTTNLGEELAELVNTEGLAGLTLEVTVGIHTEQELGIAAHHLIDGLDHWDGGKPVGVAVERGKQILVSVDSISCHCAQVTSGDRRVFGQVRHTLSRHL